MQAILIFAVVIVAAIGIWYILQPTLTPTPSPAQGIQPVEEQWANYTCTGYNVTTGEVIQFIELNIVHGPYISPDSINVTVGPILWMVVDTHTRTVVDAWQKAPYIGTEWFFMIDTNIALGSTVELQKFLPYDEIGKSVTVTVTGEQTRTVVGKSVECWELTQEVDGDLSSYWFDKVTGLLVSSDEVCLLLPSTVLHEKMVFSGVGNWTTPAFQLEGWNLFALESCSAIIRIDIFRSDTDENIGHYVFDPTRSLASTPIFTVEGPGEFYFKVWAEPDTNWELYIPPLAPSPPPPQEMRLTFDLVDTDIL
jgi:hypothetical protein